MNQRLGTYAVLNRHSGKSEDAGLYGPVSPNHIADFDQHWKPAIHQRLRAMPKGSQTGDADLQDWHWDWQKKADLFAGRLEYKSFAVECGGMTQGLMLCSLVSRAREPSQRNQHLVYVEYIHTAPWNRRRFTESPQYGGVGQILIATAISLSRNEEFAGRIGLHSLPQSEDWYRNRCGMSDLGIDTEYQGLRYFEMTSAQADRFLNQ